MVKVIILKPQPGKARKHARYRVTPKLQYLQLKSSQARTKLTACTVELSGQPSPAEELKWSLPRLSITNGAACNETTTSMLRRHACRLHVSQMATFSTLMRSLSLRCWISFRSSLPNSPSSKYRRSCAPDCAPQHTPQRKQEENACVLVHKTKLSHQTQCNAVSSRRTDTKLGILGYFVHAGRHGAQHAPPHQWHRARREQGADQQGQVWFPAADARGTQSLLPATNIQGIFVSLVHPTQLVVSWADEVH